MRYWSLRLVVIVTAALLGSAPRADAQSFTPGNLVVLRAGNGGSTSGVAAPGRLIEVNPSTGALTTVFADLPTRTAANAGGITFVEEAAGYRGGFLHWSEGRSSFTLAGFDAPVGTANIATTTASAVNRTIAQVALDRAVTVQRLTDGSFDQANPTAVGSHGSALWVGAGAPSSNGSAGLRYVADSVESSATAVVGGTTQVRDTNVFGGRLYFSTDTAIMRTQDLLPTGSSSTSSVLPAGVSLSKTRGFAFLDLNPNVSSGPDGPFDTLYVADDVKIKKFHWSGSQWTASGELDPGPLTTLHGLTARASGSEVELYLSSVDGKLARYTDAAGYAQTLSLSQGWLLDANAQFGNGYTLLGADFVPVPEPGSVLAAAAGLLGLVGLARRSRRRAAA